MTQHLKSTIDHLLVAQADASLLAKALENMQRDMALDRVADIGISENILLMNKIQFNLDMVRRDIESKLPEYTLDLGVSWAASVLRVSIANIFPTHLERMLSHSNEGIRLVAVRCGGLTPVQLEQMAMNDPAKVVRDAAIKRALNDNKPLIQKSESTPISLAAIASIP